MQKNLKLICTNNGRAYFEGFYYNGELLIRVEDLYDNGFSCYSCKYSFDCETYKEGISCKCDLRRIYNQNINTDEGNICRIDDRNICEFYDLKTPEDFDSLKMFPEFQEMEQGCVYEMLDSVFSCADLYVISLKTADEVIGSLYFLNSEIRKNYEKSEEKLREVEHFINFFKSEIPDVYKKLNSMFNMVKKNE